MLPIINNGIFPFSLFNQQRKKYPTIDYVIPKVITTDVNDTTTSTTLGICPKVWRNLPCEGVMLFEARHTPTTASADLPVIVSPTGSVNSASTTGTIPVIKSDGSTLTGSEIVAGNRYFLYYNKRENVIQVMNHYPTAA